MNTLIHIRAKEITTEGNGTIRNGEGLGGEDTVGCFDGSSSSSRSSSSVDGKSKERLGRVVECEGEERSDEGDVVDAIELEFERGGVEGNGKRALQMSLGIARSFCAKS